MLRDMVRLRQFQTLPVAVRQQIVFTVFSTLPDGPDGMKHPLRRKMKSRRRLCIACLAPTKLPALGQQFRPCPTMDRSIHTAPTQKRGVGSVHNRINSHRCDVALYRNQFGHRFSAPQSLSL